MKLETTLSPGGTMPNGLQGTDEGLWVMDQATDDVWLLDDNLSVVKSFSTPTENGSGITVGGGYIWTASNAPARARYQRASERLAPGIYKLDMDTGEEVDFFPTPDGGGVHGLEWVDGLMWITSFKPKAFKLVDPKDFRVLKTIEVPHPRPHGLAWAGDGIWMGHTGIKIISKYDMETGDEMERIEYGPDDPIPHGLTYWNGELWTCDANYAVPKHPQGPSYTMIVR